MYCVVNVSMQILNWLKWTTCPLRLCCTGFHLSCDHCCAALFGMAVLDWIPQTAFALQTSKQGKEDFWTLLLNTQPVITTKLGFTVRTAAMLWSSSADFPVFFHCRTYKKRICCVIIPKTFFSELIISSHCFHDTSAFTHLHWHSYTSRHGKLLGCHLFIRINNQSHRFICWRHGRGSNFSQVSCSVAFWHVESWYCASHKDL